jgi:hypothetical protein
MNSALAGLLTGIQGGASKYGDIKGEQRKYELDEKKADQAAQRQASYKKYNYLNYDRSGVFNKQGIEQTNQQVLDYNNSGALRGSAQNTAEVTEKARIAAEDIATTKSELAKEEARKQAEIVRDEKRDYTEGKVAERQKVLDANASDKEKKDFAKGFVTKLGSKLKDVEGKSERTEATLGLVVDVYGNAPIIANMTQVKKARWIEKGAFEASTLQSGSKSKSEIITSLQGAPLKMTAADAREAYEYSKYSGMFMDAAGPKWMTGNKGFGNR